MNHFKENLVTFLVVASTLLFFVFTPGRETLGSAVQGFIMAIIFFGLVPLGYHFLILKKRALGFGLEPAAWRNRVFVMLPVIIGALLITLLCLRFFPAFQQNFLLPQIVQGSFGWFVGYELLLVPILAAVYEIFFRGFIQKSWLEKHWGAWAIVAQSGLFVLFLLLTGSFGWATFPLVLFSFFSGFLLWYNNSLLQAWLAQWLYLLLFDVFLLITR
jgi:membrane protease YdiL (CAAX protease family)